MLSGRLAGPVPVYLLLLHWPAVDRSIVGIQWKPVGRSDGQSGSNNQRKHNQIFILQRRGEARGGRLVTYPFGASTSTSFEIVLILFLYWGRWQEEETAMTIIQ